MHTSHHHQLPPSPRVGQPGPLKRLASHLCLQRPVSRPDWRWTSSRPGSRWMSFHPGSRWTSSCPGSRWTFPAPIRGRLASILTSSRGSSCRGPCLGGPPWMRLSAQSVYGSPRHWLPLEAWTGMELAQLCQFPVVVASEPYPSCEITEAFQVSASDVHEQFSHVRHKLEWGQLFDVRPLAGLPVLHGLEECLDGPVLLLAIKMTHLSHPIAADYVSEVSFPSQDHIVGDIVHRIIAMEASSAFPGSSGGGSISPVSALRPSG